MKKIIVFGSTGSIGKNTLDVIDKHKKDFKIIGLAAGSNWKLLLKQINKFKPKIAYIENEEAYNKLNKKLLTNTKLFTYHNIKDDSKSHYNYHLNRKKSLNDFFSYIDYNMVLNSAVGLAGLIPSLETVTRGKDLLLANKESLVTAGHIIMDIAKKKNVKILPIDSEHSAIFHILKGINKNEIKRIIITASGGPFFKRNINNPNIAQVLDHPTWKMGKKLTIDSSSMMNKAFEVMEAHHLFDMPYKKIDAIIHPESIIHSMVETVDGEIYAQLGRTDMKHPIQNALTYPKLLKNKYQHLDLFKLKSLNFYKIEKKKYPVFYLALNCGVKGGSYPVVLNSANDVVTNYFLSGKIKYEDMYKLIKKAINKFPYSKINKIDDIFIIDEQVKNYLQKQVK